MAIRRYAVAVTTNGSGAATAYTPYLSGYVYEIQYVKTDFADGVDFTITSETTAKTLWTESDVNAAKVCMPRGATHSTAGVAGTYDGTRARLEPVAIGRERVKIVIAQGGDTKSGTFYVTVDDGK